MFAARRNRYHSRCNRVHSLLPAAMSGAGMPIALEKAWPKECSQFQNNSTRALSLTILRIKSLTG
jgi:hypothetical protein